MNPCKTCAARVICTPYRQRRHPNGCKQWEQIQTAKIKPSKEVKALADRPPFVEDDNQ